MDGYGWQCAECHMLIHFCVCFDDPCPHDWMLRPESDTWFCEICREES